MVDASNSCSWNGHGYFDLPIFMFNCFPVNRWLKTLVTGCGTLTIDSFARLALRYRDAPKKNRSINRQPSINQVASIRWVIYFNDHAIPNIPHILHILHILHITIIVGILPWTRYTNKIWRNITSRKVHCSWNRIVIVTIDFAG